MFAVLKELSDFIYHIPVVRGEKNPRNLLNTRDNTAFQLHILNCIQ